MKMNMKMRNTFLLASMVLATLLIVSCGEDGGGDTPEPEPTPVFAGFEFSIENDSVVTFTNKSTGAESYEWDFGDGATSTDENPIHTYTIGALEATFSVSLTAMGEGDVEDTESQDVDLVRSLDKNSDIYKLTEGATKTWKLAPMANAVNFGPKDNENTIWWGNNEDHLTQRSCLFDNTYTFSFESSEMVRDINDMLWKEYKVFSNDPEAGFGEGCLAETEEAVTRLDHNVDSWKDGTFDFAISNGDSTKILTISGSPGGYIGHYTGGTGVSYAAAEQYVYSIESITSDTLKLQGFGWGGDSDELDGYKAGEPDRLVRVTLVPVD